jgi:hypothetical protein
VPISEDEQFEKYLKGFQPTVPEPLLVAAHRKPRAWIFGAWAVVAAIVILAILVAHNHSGRSDVTTVENTGNLERPVVEAPLTLRSANKLLADAPSVKAAVDNLAFQSRNVAVPKDKQSVVSVLSKERIKL